MFIQCWHVDFYTFKDNGIFEKKSCNGDVEEKRYTSFSEDGPPCTPLFGLSPYEECLCIWMSLAWATLLHVNAQSYRFI